jgi:hypothetical protein
MAAREWRSPMSHDADVEIRTHDEALAFAHWAIQPVAAAAGTPVGRSRLLIFLAAPARASTGKCSMNLSRSSRRRHSCMASSWVIVAVSVDSAYVLAGDSPLFLGVTDVARMSRRFRYLRVSE